MNNDPSPTLPADRPLPPTQQHTADINIQSGSQSPAPEQQQHDAATSQSQSLSKSAKAFLVKKLDFLTHLSLNLDTLVYAELCVLYYMDCSFSRLFLRWMAHTLFVSPKSGGSIFGVPHHVSAMVAPNLVCMFLHLISSPLEAGEASRGYLHGGILVDFIGQKAPSSRFTLILLDAVVLAIQCFLITVNAEVERMGNAARFAPVNADPGVTITVPIAGQDHDSEERGVWRAAPETDEVDEAGHAEMRPLGNHNSGDVGDSEPADGRGRALRQSGVQRTLQFDDGLMDVLQSGNGVICNFRIHQSLQNAWNSIENTSGAASALQNVGYNATVAVLAAQRRARMPARWQREP